MSKTPGTMMRLSSRDSVLQCPELDKVSGITKSS